MARNRLVAQANAAVEAEVEYYSDEVDEAEVDEEIGEELDTSSRLIHPQSYNRSLLDLYRDLPFRAILRNRTPQG